MRPQWLRVVRRQPRTGGCILIARRARADIRQPLTLADGQGRLYVDRSRLNSRHCCGDQLRLGFRCGTSSFGIGIFNRFHQRCMLPLHRLAFILLEGWWYFRWLDFTLIKTDNTFSAFQAFLNFPVHPTT